MKIILKKHKELNNIKEALQALLDGYILKDKIGTHYYKLTNFSDQLVLASTYYSNISWDDNSKLNLQTICADCNLIAYEEVEYVWYDNIGPEGILCWVSNDKIDLIVKCIDDPYPFIGLFANYNQAIPLTRDEALIRII